MRAKCGPASQRHGQNRAVMSGAVAAPFRPFVINRPSARQRPALVNKTNTKGWQLRDWRFQMAPAVLMAGGPLGGSPTLPPPPPAKSLLPPRGPRRPNMNASQHKKLAHELPV